MITRRTKLQLLVFAIITLIGVSYVGARYAQLDRLFLDRTYSVVANFKESGGAFAGAAVTYRGFGVGKVSDLEVTDEGVAVTLEIENGYDIPADSMAVVGNRSAVGEQYVELQPQTNEGPYLAEGSQIPVEMTRTPVSTETLLTNLSNTVGSVDPKDLRTTTLEAGKAFRGTGDELQAIIDSGNAFINAADANFEVTTALIRDANTVLQGQVASESAFRRFARDLSSFSTAVAEADPALRRLIDNGSGAATELRTFLEANEVEIGELINNLVTTGEVVVKRLKGLEHVLVLYPFVVEGGFTVASKTEQTGLYDAHFGMVLTSDPPVCRQGYNAEVRDPNNDRGNTPMDENARCTEPPSQSNARGTQNIPASPRAATSWGEPDIAYDPSTGKVSWGSEARAQVRGTMGVPAPSTLGEETWKWLYLQPMLGQE